MLIQFETIDGAQVTLDTTKISAIMDYQEEDEGGIRIAIGDSQQEDEEVALQVIVADGCEYLVSLDVAQDIATVWSQELKGGCIGGCADPGVEIDYMSQLTPEEQRILAIPGAKLHILPSQLQF